MVALSCGVRRTCQWPRHGHQSVARVDDFSRGNDLCLGLLGSHETEKLPSGYDDIEVPENICSVDAADRYIVNKRLIIYIII